MTTALIDGDIVAYRMAAWAEANQLDAMDTREAVISKTREWAAGAKADKIIVALSHPTKKSFRYDILPTYKHNRKDTVPPELRRLMEDVLRDEFRTVEFPHLEADDVLGILMTNGKVDDPVCVTLDKDLLQIPGKHHNPVNQEPGELRHIKPSEGTYLFHVQWLIGDSGDGYGGIYKFGIKKAEKMLAEFWDGEAYEGDAAEAEIVDLYNQRGYEFDYCLQMAQVANILQVNNWTPNKEIVLFEPETRY